MKRWLMLLAIAGLLLFTLSTSPAQMVQAHSLVPTSTSYSFSIKQSPATSHIYFVPTYPACTPRSQKTAPVTVINSTKQTVYLWLNYWLLATLKPGQRVTGRISMTGLDFFTFDVTTVEYTSPHDATATITACN